MIPCYQRQICNISCDISYKFYTGIEEEKNVESRRPLENCISQSTPNQHHSGIFSSRFPNSQSQFLAQHVLEKLHKHIKPTVCIWNKL